MSYQIRYYDGALKDLSKLDNSQLLHIKKSFHKLEQVGGQAGEALRGSLQGYRKLKHKRLGLRVIFRETLDGIEIIEVVAVGKRSDNEIYKIAEKRIKEIASFKD